MVTDTRVTASGTRASETVAWVLRLILLPLVLLAAVTLGVGWLIIKPLHAEVAGEVAVNQGLAEDRTRCSTRSHTSARCFRTHR